MLILLFMFMLVFSSGGDLDHFDSDLVPTFHFDAALALDPDPII